MTALVRANIPAAINTIEQLTVWCVQALQSANPTLTVNVVENQNRVRSAECQLYTTADGLPRFVLSAYLPITLAVLNSSTQKTWLATQELSTTAPHVNFNTD